MRFRHCFHAVSTLFSCGFDVVLRVFDAAFTWLMLFSRGFDVFTRFRCFHVVSMRFRCFHTVSIRFSQGFDALSMLFSWGLNVIFTHFRYCFHAFLTLFLCGLTLFSCSFDAFWMPFPVFLMLCSHGIDAVLMRFWCWFNAVFTLFRHCFNAVSMPIF